MRCKQLNPPPLLPVLIVQQDPYPVGYKEIPAFQRQEAAGKLRPEYLISVATICDTPQRRSDGGVDYGSGF